MKLKSLYSPKIPLVAQVC